MIVAYRPLVVTAELVHPTLVPNTHHLSVKVALIKTVSNELSTHLASFHCVMDTLTSENNIQTVNT